MSEVTSVKLGARKAELQQLAGLAKRSVHSLVLEAVDEYLESQQKRLTYEQRAIQAYEHYQATGLHIRADELDAWADSLLTEVPQDFPQCHR